MRKAQDYELWLRAAAAGLAISRLGMPVIGYRLASNQVSAQTNYTADVAASPELRSAYVSLARALGQTPRDNSREGSPTFVDVVPHFTTPGLRRYYGGLARNGVSTLG